MANEITAKSYLAVSNGNDVFKSNGGTTLTQTHDQSGNGRFSRIVSIATSDTEVTLSDITTEGWAWFRNLDATNYVDWGPDSTGIVQMGRMEAGEVAGPFRLYPGVTLQMQANTAACDVEVVVLED